MSIPLVGGSGNDSLGGGSGNDALYGGNDGDFLSGASTRTTCFMAATVATY